MAMKFPIIDLTKKSQLLICVLGFVDTTFFENNDNFICNRKHQVTHYI